MKFELNDYHRNTTDEELIDDVISEFSDFSGDELSEITHLEGPWVSTRRGLKDGDSDNRVIDETLMREYYSQLR